MTLKEFQAQWSKEISRIKRAIGRLESRGYTVDYELPERPKGIAPRQLQELRSETTHAKMIKRSTYVTKEGEIISGYQAETQARKESARKGQLTRKRKQYKDQQKRYKEWQQKKRMEQWKEKSLPQFSTVVLENLRRQLSAMSRGFQSNFARVRQRANVWEQTIVYKTEVARSLLEMLELKVAQEGERKIALQLETQASKVNEYLEGLIQASTQQQINDASVPLATIINGSSLTKEQSEALTPDDWESILD